MAGAISSKDKMRIFNIIDRGYIQGGSNKEFEAIMNLAFISSFNPQIEQVCSMFIEYAKKYHPKLLKEEQ